MADTEVMRLCASIISLSGRCAAPIQSPADINDCSLVVLRSQEENALNAALPLLRNLRFTDTDLQRATGRVCSAATLMHRIYDAQAEGGAV